MPAYDHAMSPRPSSNAGNKTTAKDNLGVSGASAPSCDFQPYSSDTPTPQTSAAAKTVTAKTSPGGNGSPGASALIMPWALVAGAICVVSCVPQLQFPGWHWTVGVLSTAMWATFVIVQLRNPLQETASWSWPAMGLSLAGLAALVVSWWACLSWASSPAFSQSWDWAIGGPTGGWVMWPVVAITPVCGLAVATHTKTHWSRYTQSLTKIADPGTTAQVDLHGVLAVAARENLATGAVCLVQEGQPTPADCVVVNGAGHVDDGFLPTQSRRRPVGLGDWIPAGAINVGPALTVRVVAEPHRGRMKSLRKALRFWWATPHRCDDELWAKCLQQTLVCVIAGGLTAGAWLFVRPEVSLTALVAVMAAAIPGAWWLSRGLRARGFQSWLLLRGSVMLNPQAAGKLAKCKGAVVDTQSRGWVGSGHVVKVEPAPGWHHDQVLATAGQVTAQDARPWCQVINAASHVWDFGADTDTGEITDPSVASASRRALLDPTSAHGKVGAWQVEVSYAPKTSDLPADVPAVVSASESAASAPSSGQPAMVDAIVRVTADGHEIGRIYMALPLLQSRTDLVSSLSDAKRQVQVVSTTSNSYDEEVVDTDSYRVVPGEDWAEFMTSLQLAQGPQCWVSSSADPTLPNFAGASVFCGEAAYVPAKGTDVHMTSPQPDVASMLKQARKVRRSAHVRAAVFTTVSAALAVGGGLGAVPPVCIALGVTAAFMVTIRSAGYSSVQPD